MAVSDDDIRLLIYRSCLYLNREDFDAYLGLCAPEMRYQITGYSKEIRKDMIWMNHSRDGLATLFENLPHHIRVQGSLMRHVTVYEIDRDGSTNRAAVTSSFIMIQTDNDGVSSVFAAGHYHDDVDASGDTPRLLSRTARLETRDIGLGSPYPI